MNTENKVIFMGYHPATIVHDKVTVPASLVTIEQCNEVDAEGQVIIAKLNQRYARPNRKFKDGLIGLDMFKGKRGIEWTFYSMDEMKEFLEAFIDDGYKMKRLTAHNENGLADTLFTYVQNYMYKNMRENGGFKLPS